MIELKIKGHAVALCAQFDGNEQVGYDTIHIFTLENAIHVQGTLDVSTITDRVFVSLNDVMEVDKDAVQMSEKNMMIRIFPPFILDVMAPDEEAKKNGVDDNIVWITKPFSK